MSNAIEHINQLVSKPEHTATDLEILLLQYASVSASGTPNFIIDYYPQLDQLFANYENDFQVAKGLRHLLLAITCYYQTKFDETIASAQKAVTLFTELKHNDLLGLSHWALGANYRSLGEIDEAVKELYLGLEHISSQGNFALYKCFCYYQLAEINVSINDKQAARINYLKAISLAETLDNVTAKFRVNNGFANLLMAEKKSNEALAYFEKSLAPENITNSQRSRTYCDLGFFYFNAKDLQQSKSYFEQSVQIRKDANLEDASSTALIGLGGTLLALNQVETAIATLNEALVICKEFNSQQKLMNCYHLLAQAYQKNKDWELSTQTYAQYDTIQLELNANQLQKIYKLKNDKIEQQKQQIETILTDVHDSISYAKRIQQAIFPSDGLIEQNLLASFVYYKPKDIVAGDFYWMHLLPEPNGWEVNGDVVLFAAADCTGHGVPGALVSIVCNNALNQSVKEFGITQPSLILDKTRELVIETFSESEENVKDGMDIALCSLNAKTNTLNYAGANNPIWIIRKGAIEIEEIKGNKQPIGNFELATPFTNHTIQLNKGDVFYIFSDGFVDQFGGPKGKKFKAKAFRKLLLSIQEQSMSEQKTIIDETFETWNGNLEQIDDVCVIGIRI